MTEHRKVCECGIEVEFRDGIPYEVETGLNHFINCIYKEKYKKKYEKKAAKPLPEGQKQMHFHDDGINVHLVDKRRAEE